MAPLVSDAYTPGTQLATSGGAVQAFPGVNSTQAVRALVASPPPALIVAVPMHREGALRNQDEERNGGESGNG